MSAKSETKTAGASIGDRVKIAIPGRKEPLVGAVLEVHANAKRPPTLTVTVPNGDATFTLRGVEHESVRDPYAGWSAIG